MTLPQVLVVLGGAFLVGFFAGALSMAIIAWRLQRADYLARKASGLGVPTLAAWESTPGALREVPVRSIIAEIYASGQARRNDDGFGHG
jgi:hypothetical protein